MNRNSFPRHSFSPQMIAVETAAVRASLRTGFVSAARGLRTRVYQGLLTLLG
jgi:hypothetical protein